MIKVLSTGPALVAQALVAKQIENGKIQDMRDKIAHSKEAYALYAKDIRGNRDFAEMPLNAATSADNVGTLGATVVALRSLDLFKLSFPMLGVITTDFSDEPGLFNQTTKTRIVVVPPVMSYNATIGADGRPIGWVIGTQAQAVDVPVTLDAHKAVEICFDANTLAGTARRLFDEQAPATGYALAKNLVDALYAKITTDAFTTNAAFAESSVDFGRRTFAKASRILTEQGAPIINRFALVNAVYHEKLEIDPTILALAVYQKPEILTDSQLPRLSSIQPWLAPNLPSTGNLAAFFGHRSSLVVQTRVPNDYTTVLGPAASYGAVSVVTNPDLGMSTLLTQYTSHQGGYAAWRQAIMYGVAVGNEKGGQIVTSV